MFKWLRRFFLLEKEQEIVDVFAPFDLDNGFVLTEPDILIPWQFTTDILQSIGNPVVQGESDFFTWPNQNVFGVLVADVVVSPHYLTMVDKPGMKFAEFQVKPKLKLGELFDDVKHMYEFTTQRVIDALGSPHITKSNQSLAGDELPDLKWIYGSVTVFIVVRDRFVDYLNFRITKTFSQV